MRCLKFCVFFFLFLFAAGLVVAQEEEIITEASEPSDEEFLDGVVKKTLIYENRVMEYEPIREADIAWEKRIWRVIDVREKMNLHFLNQEKPFLHLLKDAALNGDITVFNDDEFSDKLEPEEVLGRFVRMDTTLVYDPDTYEEIVEVTRNDLDYNDIKKYRVKELWFYDEETSTMRVRILGMAPIKDEYDENGYFKYAAPMFWIYYPQTREVLARERVFNTFNDASPMTWYDLFEARFFSSYIYKQSNPLNLRLKDIYPQNGVDRLIESERIKQELLNLEQDLWSY